MTEVNPHCLFIIDGHSILYKGFFAIKGLSTKSGMPTSAIFGFAQMLLRVIREAKPERLCVAFDSKAPTFREEIYPDYKANRPIMPTDLQMQFPYVKRMLNALHITQLVKDTYEADDIIATLAAHAEQRGWHTRVVTADKDLFQIVTGKTHILRFQKKQIEEYDPTGVLKKMGVAPERITDLLGLMGDATDNIPGIRGIGPVTAKKLLGEFGTLESLIEQAENISNPKLREKVKEGTEAALLSKRLATVKRDVPLEIDFETFDFTEEVTPELETLFEELEFKGLLATLKKRHTKREVNYRTLRSKQALEEFVKAATNAGLVAIDTETTSTDPMQCRLVGVSMSHKPGEAVYVPVGHSPEASGGEQISTEDLRRILAPLLKSADVKKSGHNIKYDIKVLHRAGLHLNNIFFDTMLASYLLNPDRASHGLKTLAPQELGIEMMPITDLIGKGKRSFTMDKVPVEAAANYACLDADATLQLVHYFAPKLKDANLNELFETLEMPLIDVLAEMEMAGVAIDVDYFHCLAAETKKHLDTLEAECYESAGHPFNLNSPKQVSRILFQEIKLTPIKRGKTQYSTDVTVLESLVKEHPLPGKLLEYRSYEKLLSTYIEVLPRQVNPETGRVHTSYIQSRAATGRLSSREPNLQNIPVRTPQGRAIRAGFIPGEVGWLLLSADYSQIELRILAHLSGDAMLVKAFREGADIHRLTAVRIFGGLEEFITPEMRDAAKTINFGVIYGMSANGLAQQLGISRTEARKFIDDYFESYSGVKRWIGETIDLARTNGYVKTLLGRKRYVPNLNSSNKNLKAAAERIAVNTPIQGTSADMIKKAMLGVHKRLKRGNLNARLLMQVHDELIFEVPEKEVESLTALAIEEMGGALPLNVPVKVSVQTGNNWAEC